MLIECTKNRLAAGLRPNPMRELKRSPRPLAATRDNSRGGGEREREGRGEGRGEG